MKKKNKKLPNATASQTQKIPATKKGHPMGRFRSPNHDVSECQKTNKFQSHNRATRQTVSVGGAPGVRPDLGPYLFFSHIYLYIFFGSYTIPFTRMPIIIVIIYIIKKLFFCLKKLLIELTKHMAIN